MKKILLMILVIVICFGFSFTAYAEEAVTEDASQPRLMLTDYSVDGGSLKPNKKSELTVTFKNYSKTKSISNIKLSLSDESGDIKTQGTGTQYIDKISAGGTYKWKVMLTASKTSEIGEHTVNISSEYEDKYYTQYASSDIIRINVKQSVGLDYSGVQLPVKVYQEDTVTMDISLMNTGKSNIRNCKIDFDINALESGGSTYVGEIAAGDSTAASANLRVSSTELGDTAGIVTITYEDEFGKEYKKTADVSTKIEEKPVVADTEDEEQEKNNKLWWLFIIIGIVVGGAIGAAIPISINAHRQRKQDELNL